MVGLIDSPLTTVCLASYSRENVRRVHRFGDTPSQKQHLPVRVQRSTISEDSSVITPRLWTRTRNSQSSVMVWPPSASPCSWHFTSITAGMLRDTLTGFPASCVTTLKIKQQRTVGVWSVCWRVILVLYHFAPLVVLDHFNTLLLQHPQYCGSVAWWGVETRPRDRNHYLSRSMGGFSLWIPVAHSTEYPHHR